MGDSYLQNDVVTSAILLASEEGNLDALEQLVNIHRLDLNVTNQLQESPLHFASSSGNEKVVAYLLRRGLNVEAEDSRGDTPLFYAARNGHAKLIRFMCAGSNRLVVADVNKQNKSLESPLIIAVRYLQIESALALLESGANVNIQDEVF
jgi:ankyrin repeat protein